MISAADALKLSARIVVEQLTLLMPESLHVAKDVDDFISAKRNPRENYVYYGMLP